MPPEHPSGRVGRVAGRDEVFAPIGEAAKQISIASATVPRFLLISLLNFSEIRSGLTILRVLWRWFKRDGPEPPGDCANSSGGNPTVQTPGDELGELEAKTKTLAHSQLGRGERRRGAPRSRRAAQTITCCRRTSDDCV